MEDTRKIALIDKSIGSDGSHFDVACVVHAFYSGQYIYENETWYMFSAEDHRWLIQRKQKEYTLRLALSEEICCAFMQRSKYWGLKATDTNDEDERKTNENKQNTLMKIAKQLKMAGYKDSVLKECTCKFAWNGHTPFLQTLDEKPHLICFKNGVYDLKAKEFRDGRYEDFISLSTNIDYVPIEKCDPKHIEEINEYFAKVFMRADTRSFVFDLMALMIDTSIKLERLFLFNGSGSNSKSKLLELLGLILGDYYTAVPVALLTQKRASSNAASSEIVRLRGRRLAVMSEPNIDDEINLGLMKELTGNDRIQARGLYQEPIEFTPQCRWCLLSNELPRINGTDGGTWRRIKNIEFKSKFVDNPTKANEFPIDITINQKFAVWSTTLMSMIVEHHNTTDLLNIIEPIDVQEGTEHYRRLSDSIGTFMSDRVVKSESAKCLKISAVYSDFKPYFKRNFPNEKRMPEQKTVKARLEKDFGIYDERKGWSGIRIKLFREDAEDSEEAQEFNDGERDKQFEFMKQCIVADKGCITTDELTTFKEHHLPSIDIFEVKRYITDVLKGSESNKLKRDFGKDKSLGYKGVTMTVRM